MVSPFFLLLALAQGSPCPTWRGYDAEHHRDICGPAERAVSEQELLSYEKRHLPDIKRSVEADYVYTCGLRSSQWRAYARGRAEEALNDDPMVRRTTDAQKAELREWNAAAKQSVIRIYGAGPAVCRRFIGSDTLTELDRLAYPIVG